VNRPENTSEPTGTTSISRALAGADDPSRLGNVRMLRGLGYAVLFELPLVLAALASWLVWKALR
jgi:hypothetical protein